MIRRIVLPDGMARYAELSGAPRPAVTMEWMREIVNASYRLPFVVTTAGDIVDDVDGKDAGAMAAALLAWMRAHTRFVPDPVAFQLLQSPCYMLEKIRDSADHRAPGDCVDVAMLGASLALALGIPAALVAESYAEPCTASSPLVHIYSIANAGPRWVHLDTQQPAEGPPQIPCKRVEMPLP